MNEVFLLVGLSKESQIYVDSLKSNKACFVYGVGLDSFVANLDFHIASSTFWTEASLQSVKQNLRNVRNIAGVFSRTSGPPLFLHYSLATQFSVAGPSKEFISACVDLKSLYLLLEKLKIPSANGEILQHHELGIVRFLDKQLRYPFVIKPSISLKGKAFVRLIESRKQFIDNFNQVSWNSSNKAVAVEPYLPGVEHQVFALAHRGKIRKYNIISDKSFISNDGVILGERSNYIGSNDLKESMLRMSKKIVGSSKSSGTHVITFRDTIFGKLIVTELGYGVGGDGVFEDGWLDKDWINAEVSLMRKTKV